MYRILNFILEPKKLYPYSEVGGAILERTYILNNLNINK